MERKIKFRAWDGEKMHYNIVPWRWDFVIDLGWHRCEKSAGNGVLGSGGKNGEFLVPGIAFKELMQFTGLKEKSDDNICLYEGDLVSLLGKIIGNKYENESLLEERTNLLITEMGTNSWRTTEQEAMLRGFKYAK